MMQTLTPELTALLPPGQIAQTAGNLWAHG